MSDNVKFNPKDLSPPKVHGLLLSAVAPRPIAFVSTISESGDVNLSPFSFFNVFSSNPPIAIFSPSRSGKTNQPKHSYLNVKEVPEAVINVVSYEMVEKMSLSSSNYARGVNEFDKAGFTAIKSDLVKPPRVDESPVSFECTVNEVIELGDHGGAGNLVICEVLMIHTRKRFLDDKGMIDTSLLDLVGRMGGNWYSRTNSDAIFELPKPGPHVGIGVDELPASVRNSDILSANNLGRLGGVESMPNEADLEMRKIAPEVKSILLESKESKETAIVQLHHLAKNQIHEGNTMEALEILIIADQLI
jgi:flavin reductase (DIM6/NTAB) family NADH-FMN oxidoreductase RutF